MYQNALSAILSLLLLFLIGGCQDGPPGTRKVDQINEYGEREVFFVHRQTGARTGDYQRFSPDGILIETAHYENGQYQGQRILYYASGDTHIVESYQMGQFAGPYRSYYPGGQLELSGQYINHAMEGVWKRFYESGELMEEVTFAENMENGPFTEYYKNGGVQITGTYLNGDYEHGALLFYDLEGKLTKKMDCDRGVCRTVWSESKGDPMN